jgi:hypothetical protein
MTLPRFSLRLLLLAVAVLCAWLAWERSVVMERRAALNILRKRGAAFPLTRAHQQSWLRQAIGEFGYVPAVILIPPNSWPDAGELKVIQATFPEATIERLGPNSPHTGGLLGDFGSPEAHLHQPPDEG